MVSNESWAGAFWLRVGSWKLEVGRFKLAVISRKSAVVSRKLAVGRGGLGSAVAVFQTDDVVFAQVIPELDFDELH